MMSARFKKKSRSESAILSADQEGREGSGPLTARQPATASKVPKPARKRER